jgi:CHAT domain-containing protein
VRARMNANDQLFRLFTALQARLKLGVIEQNRGNYSAADEQFSTMAHVIPRLFAAGAPDEQELTRWLDEQAAQVATQTATQTDAAWSIRSVDIAAHRKQMNVTPDAGELERLHQAELLANSLRALLALKRAQLLHDQGDLVEAADGYRDAIKQIANVLGGAFPLAGAQLALAQIERERGHYEAAEAPLQIALAESQRAHDAAAVAGILAQTAVLRLREGRLDEARRAADNALQVAREVNERAQLANLLQVLGRIESEQGGAALSGSEQHLREALGLARELGERGRIAYTLSDLGLTLEREGREREALASYEEAVRLVETLTASLSKEVSAEVFSTKRGNRELYERLIHLLIKNGRAADALGYLERAKAKSLVEALAGAEVSTNDPKLKELIQRVRATTAAVRAAEATLTTEMVRPAATRNAAQIKVAQANLTRAQADYTAAVVALQQANPAYASLVAVRSTDLTQIRQTLAPGTLLIEYFPTDTTLYIFYLSHAEAPQVRAVALKHDKLAQLVNEYRAAVIVPSKSAAFARARGLAAEMDTGSEVKQAIHSMQEITGQLYDVLFAPVQAEIDRADTLLLVPAAELYYLPLHALGRMQPDGSISYLVEQKRFAYLAAADAINTVAAVNPNGHRQGAAKEELLALGNPDGSLPAAAEEVQTLSHIFPQADIYTGKDATLARIASTQPTQPVPYIHFATHGVINSREPKESYLLLAGKPGRLSVKDLVEDTYGMSFNGTRLVTLSACQTSIGGWDPSAVYSSLSRAFAKAGAPTVVASLWSVNDTATRDMMTVFYKELAAGQPKAEAMRRAQLAVMHDARFTHPFFWAPFIVLGDWR